MPFLFILNTLINILGRFYLVGVFFALGLILQASVSLLAQVKNPQYIPPYYPLFGIKPAQPGSNIGITQATEKIDVFLSAGVLEPQFAINNLFTAGWLIHGITSLERIPKNYGNYRVITLVTSYYYLAKGGVRPKIGLGLGVHTTLNTINVLAHAFHEDLFGPGLDIAPSIGLDIVPNKNARKRGIGHLTATVFYNFVFNPNFLGYGLFGLYWTIGAKKKPTY